VLMVNQFMQLFRNEAYAIQLALYEDGDLQNPFENILRKKSIPGIWDKEYSVVPVGRLAGRTEDQPIPKLNLTMGYTAYGALKIEATGRLSLSKHMKLWAKKFAAAGGQSPESSFAGYIADAGARSILSRRMLKEHEYFAMLFNYGGIPGGNAFFNQRTRAEGISDIPNIQTIYDGVSLFAFANAPHPSYAAGRTVGPGGAPTGNNCGIGAANAATAIADTGGYFNAFQLPPSYWALKRVLTHYENNMAFDENDVPYAQTPTVLLVSQFNEARWREILDSKFVAYTATNTENVFQEEGGRFRVQLVVSRLLLRNTWFVGKANSPGIYRMYPSTEDDPWAYWREESSRSYWLSYDQSWGFMIRNWRYWVGGSVSDDGETPPVFPDPADWESNQDTCV